MKLLYLANIRLPTEKAHGLQIMKMCEAFMHENTEVQLVVPARRNHISENPFSYYGIKQQFPIIYLPVWDTVAWGRIGFLFESLQFALKAAMYTRKYPPDVLYSRDELPLLVASYATKLPAIWEVHTGAWNFFAKKMSQLARAVIVISHGLKDFYVAKGVSAERIVVAHDAIDSEDFSRIELPENSRMRLGIPIDKKIALYVGRLDGWKGANVFCEAAQLLPKDILAVVIGGEEQQVSLFKKKYPEVLFLGYMPYRDLPSNQAAADVLVLPNSSKDQISVLFASPLKLFTYMASGKPIVASNLPSLKEVLPDAGAFFVPPDDPNALAGGIVQAVSNPQEGKKRAEQARELVKEYSWYNRAHHILLCIKK